MSFHILISDHLHPAGWNVLRASPEIVTSGPFTSRAQILSALPQADALIIRSSTFVDQELLDAAPRLKVIARAGARLDNVDLDAATRRGILVLNAPDANLFAVAEHTFALLLALARHIPQGHNAVHAGRWPRHDMLGFQLHGKILGILGFGRLGREIATRAQAFGMTVLAYDPYADLSFARERGVEITGFPELLARADVLVLATIPKLQDPPLLNAEAFKGIKPGAYLLNAAEAGLVDERALLEALDGGTLAGAALDVFDQEPPPAGDRLSTHPRVIATPHLNQNTVESQAITSIQIVHDVLDALRGRDYRNVVNLPFNDRAPYTAVKPSLHLAGCLGKLLGQTAGGWITRVEVELLGEGLRDLVRPVTAVLLSGMIRPKNGTPANWVNAPVLAHEQGIVTAQAKHLLDLPDYPNALVCRVIWVGDAASPGERTVAGVLFANGEARVVHYGGFSIDALPDGYILILENDDVPGVIGKVGTRLGRAGINIANWRYGREMRGGRALSFISLDSRAPKELLRELEREPEILRAQLVRL
ncbi:MAG TPA: phosphoglycerate dehydrogenase [Anaerolineales bacterium]|nr:phosphoglycerate dehydrogenase [Anaerolineales bacterium]